MKKRIKYSASIFAYLVLCYFFPYVFVTFLLIGLYDVLRNENRSFSVLKRYFFVNGGLTWLAAPLNLMFDVFSLPFINKRVYKLDDLPPSHQEEIAGLIATVKRGNLNEKIAKFTEGLPRAMFFFKWYGRNVDCPLNLPAFQKDFRFVRTVGISAFNQRESTVPHFGPLRACFRVLYCITDEKDERVYIQVGNVTHRWKDEKLFIFDDTLLHQSFNESDHQRYCLFVDILRPGYLSFINDLAVKFFGFVLAQFRGGFYKRWKVIEN